jgi:hypothetical protein
MTANNPASPFAGLDKALLRSTQQPAHPVSNRKPRAARETVEPANDDAEHHKIASKPASRQASELASVLASSTELIETIRKTVKVPGKEVSFVRLTAREKGELADIVYTYKRRGKKTTENEINRIAVNLVLEDYKAHGEASILARVIDALLA